MMWCDLLQSWCCGASGAGCRVHGAGCGCKCWCCFCCCYYCYLVLRWAVGLGRRMTNGQLLLLNGSGQAQYWALAEGGSWRRFGHTEHWRRRLEGSRAVLLDGSRCAVLDGSWCWSSNGCTVDGSGSSNWCAVDRSWSCNGCTVDGSWSNGGCTVHSLGSAVDWCRSRSWHANGCTVNGRWGWQGNGSGSWCSNGCTVDGSRHGCTVDCSWGRCGSVLVDDAHHLGGCLQSGSSGGDARAMGVALVQYLDDLWGAALNDGSATDVSATNGARFLVQYLDHLNGGGSLGVVVVDGSGSGARAARDDLHFVDLRRRSIAVAAGITAAGVTTTGVTTTGVATARDAALLVNDLNDLDGSVSMGGAATIMTAMGATIGATIRAATAAATSTATQTQASLKSTAGAATTTAAATTAEQTQEASIGHSEESTQANEDLEEEDGGEGASED